MEKMKKWLGTVYNDCQLCGGKLGKVFYDARIPRQGWGVVCHACFRFHGCKLGVGCGQKYDSKTLVLLGGGSE